MITPKEQKIIVLIIVLTCLHVGITEIILPATQPKAPVEIISPCPDSGCAIITQAPTPTQTPTETPKRPQTPVSDPTSGKASYYSINGCIGCNPDRIMANGERLDDNRMTVAYNHAPMNTKVIITNTKNGKTVVATVTDTGGFERHGKIADLSVATKNALGCGDVCNITILKGGE